MSKIMEILTDNTNTLEVESSDTIANYEDDGDMRIFIDRSVQGKTTLTLDDVKSSYTIKFVKTLIQQQTGGPLVLKRLIFNGKQLEDGLTLADYNIKKESVLYLLSRRNEGGFQISCKTHQGGETSMLEVESSYTIKTVKLMIQEETELYPEQQRLLFGWKPLEDNHTLAYYNIKKDSVLHLGSRLRGGGFQIYYDPKMDKTSMGTSCRSMCFQPIFKYGWHCFNDKKEVCRILAVHKETLHMSPLIGGGVMRIFIDMSVQEKKTLMSLDVKSSYTIKNVKLVIQQDTGVSQVLKRLIFDGKELEDSRTLADYNIKKKSVLYLVSRLNVGGFQISYKTPTGRISMVEVERFNTIENVKLMIQEETGIYQDQQRLIFGGKELEDNHTLAYYKIKKDSPLQLILNLRGGGFHISYEALIGKTFMIGIESSDSPPMDSQDLERGRADTTLAQPSSWLQRLRIVISVRKWGYRFFGSWK